MANLKGKHQTAKIGLHNALQQNSSTISKEPGKIGNGFFSACLDFLGPNIINCCYFTLHSLDGNNVQEKRFLRIFLYFSGQ